MKGELFCGMVKQLHLVGIGGIGMSAIAEVLLRSGYEVSGSDLVSSSTIKRLRELGAVVHIGHAPSNLGQAQVVVFSSAVSPHNLELQEARKRRIPVVHRSEVLAELMRFKCGIAVSGTHGKTTASAMIATLLTEADLDPTALIGARVPRLGGNARLGKGFCLVAEADESDRSFLNLPSICSVVTNIDLDHMDTYGSLADLQEAFLQFMSRVPFYGQVIACSDDAGLGPVLKKVHRRVLTYGLEDNADICARNLQFDAFSSRYDCYVSATLQGRVQLKVPGQHNVLNSLAAVGVGLWLELPFQTVSRSLEAFAGTERRLQWKGEAGGVWVLDDYGHHPTEIAATLSACRGLERRLVVVYQPHRYSRTQQLMGKMSQCFEAADVLYVIDIYGAGEKPIPGVTSEKLSRTIARTRQASYAPEPEELVQELIEKTRPGDLLLTLGAGDVWRIGEEFLERKGQE